MTAGWTSLEANETFFGSAAYVDGGISTGILPNRFVLARLILVTKEKQYRLETAST